MSEAISVFIGHESTLLSLNHTAGFNQSHICFTGHPAKLQLHQCGQSLLHRFKQ